MGIRIDIHAHAHVYTRSSSCPASQQLLVPSFPLVPAQPVLNSQSQPLNSPPPTNLLANPSRMAAVPDPSSSNRPSLPSNTAPCFPPFHSQLPVPVEIPATSFTRFPCSLPLARGRWQVGGLHESMAKSLSLSRSMVDVTLQSLSP